MLNDIETEDIEEWQSIDKIDEIDKESIHSVFAIKDWMFEMIEKTELDKKNYFYRVHSKVPGVVVIDYDKTNVVPIVKDILNRQNTFVEIKYLRWVIGLNIVLILGLVIVWILIPFGRSNFDTQKTEIITEIRKYWMNAINQQQWSPTPGQIVTPPKTSPSTTQTDWYNPIFPQETTPNNHKNIPSYAN